MSAKSAEYRYTFIYIIIYYFLYIDRSMYEPSRIMRSIQYIFDQNVLRVWNDAVLSIEDKDEFGALTGTNRLIGP